MKSPDTHFFHSPLTCGTLTLSEEESKHAIRVCRAQKGDVLRLCDGEGHLANAVILNADSRACSVQVETIEMPEPNPPRLRLAIACLKDDGNEEIALHAAEAAVDEIILLRTEFSQEPKNSDLSRLVRRSELKCRVSLKQSMKPWETKIRGPFPLNDWLQTVTGTLVLCDLNGAETLPPGIKNQQELITLLIGPEGGFSKKEIETIQNVPLAKTILLKLGDTRLRARTAALFAIGKCL